MTKVLQKFLYKSGGAGVYWVKIVNPGELSNVEWCRRLYEEKAAALILYGRALGLSHAAAEDVVQETFAVLLEREEPPAEPVNYLLRAFRNRALNHHRSLWRRLAREWESLRWFEPGPEESPGERKAMRCLARLPAEQREVIVLKIWHGHTFAEIGDLLTVSPNTVAGRYRYGLRKLRECLKETSYERIEDGKSIALVDAAPPVGGA